MVTEFRMYDEFGRICTNGDKAFDFMKGRVVPALEHGDIIVFDFSDVRSINSSFSNALFGKMIAIRGKTLLDQLRIVHCSESIKQIIESALYLGLQHSGDSQPVVC